MVRAAVSGLLLLLSLLFAAPALAQPLLPAQAAQPNGDDLEVSVLTFGPGEIYWERFGHNAILVRNHATGAAVAFNYGMFDFKQKNFFLNFARGYMLYRIAADPLERDLDIYRYEGRWVQEQKLNLTPAQRLALLDYLRWNVQPENRDYRYDYFLSNCSTKVRDALDQVLGGALRKQLEAKMTSNSYRFDAVRLVSPDFWAGIGMDVALGPVADQPQSQLQESFVPMVLMQQLREAKITDAEGHEQPLVLEDKRILEAHIPDDPPQPPDWRLDFLLAGLGFAALLLVLGRFRRAFAARLGFMLLASAYSLLCGVCGLILLALWFLTQHWAGWHNENLLLLNPLCLLLLPAWLMSARARWRPRPWAQRLIRIVAALAAFSLLLRLVPGCFQANLPWILLLLPPHLALLYSARRAAAGA
jgi:hypothetical protein